MKLLSGAVWLEHLDDACTYFCVILIDVLVVGQLHQAMAQVVVGEDEETGFQVTVDLFQILEETQKDHTCTFSLSDHEQKVASNQAEQESNGPCHAQRAAEGRWQQWR